MASAVRLFMTYAEFERLARDSYRRPKRVTTDLARIVLPSERRMYPIDYIRALLSGTAGSITGSLVRHFNNSPHGQRTIASAKTTFASRLDLLATSSQHPGYLPIASISSLLSLCPTTLYQWYANGLLPGTEIDGQKHVCAADLVQRWAWRP